MAEIDREKVAKGLKLCVVTGDFCGECPYDEMESCIDHLHDDALSLLEDMNKINKETGALKLTHEATLFKSFTCPHCKNVIRDVINKEEEFDCPYCGQRLKKGWKDTINEKGRFCCSTY